MHRWKEHRLCEDPWWRCGDLGSEDCLLKSKRALGDSWEKGSGWVLLQQFPFIERHTSKKRKSSTRKKNRNTQGCQIASFWVNVCFSAKRPGRSSSLFLDKPRPGQGIGAAGATAPDGDCWGTEQKNYRRSAAAAGKNSHVQDVNFVRNLASSDILFFLLFDQTASRFFPLPIFNHDELKRSLTHPSLALTNMQHSR